MEVKKREFFWEVIFWIVLLAGIYMSFGVYGDGVKSIFIGIIAGMCALLFAALKISKIMSKDKGCRLYRNERFNKSKCKDGKCCKKILE